MKPNFEAVSRPFLAVNQASHCGPSLVRISRCLKSTDAKSLFKSTNSWGNLTGATLGKLVSPQSEMLNEDSSRCAAFWKTINTIISIDMKEKTEYKCIMCNCTLWMKYSVWCNVDFHSYMQWKKIEICWNEQKKDASTAALSPFIQHTLNGNYQMLKIHITERGFNNCFPPAWKCVAIQ